MGVTTSGNHYQGAKRKKDPVVVMKTGGETSSALKSMSYLDRLEYLNNKYVPNITSAIHRFVFSETGFFYDLNNDEKLEKENILDKYFNQSDYSSETLDSDTNYKVEDWSIVRKEIDPETDEVYDTTELTMLISDNTSNYEYKGLIDLNYRLYYDEDYGTYFLIAHPHLGGDIRGNYGSPFILEGDDKDELLQRFLMNYVVGTFVVSFKFTDGSEIDLFSENFNDVLNFSFEGEEPSPMSYAGKYLSDIRDLKGEKADDLIQETVQEYNKSNIPKMNDGGGVLDEKPRAYIKIVGYPEAKWIDIIEFSDGEDVMKHIHDWMKSLNKEKGGNREEYEVHDYEGFGKKLYSESMGENAFDEIIEGYELYDKSDFPSEVIDEYMNQKNFDEYDDAIEDMNKKYYGSYDRLASWANQMVDEGVFTPSVRDMFVTDADKRILASDIADSKVEEMDASQLLELVDKYGEYKKAKEKLENDLTVQENKLDTIQSLMEKADGDDYEAFLSEDIDIRDNIDNLQDKIDALEDSFVQKYKDDAVSSVYDSVYKQLNENLKGFLDEYGYSSDLTNIPFVNIDYETIAKELKNDYYIFEFNGRYFVFNSYKKGGAVVRIGKPNPKYKYFVIELGSGKIVSGWEYKSDAQDDQKNLKKENPKLSFGVYSRDKAELKFGVDTVTYRDWIKTNQLDALSNVSLSSEKKSFADGGMTYSEPKSRWEKAKHYAKVGADHTKMAYDDTKSWVVENDVKGKIGNAYRSALTKSKEGLSWLKQQWHDADFGDGKGEAKLFNDGGDVDRISWAKTKARDEINWDEKLREYAGDEYSKLTAEERQQIISDMMRDWDSHFSYSEGGEVQFIPYNGQEIMYSPHFNQYFVNDEAFNSLEEAKAFIDKGSPISDWKKEAYRKGYFKKGGTTTKAYDVLDNKRMLLNQAKEAEHHAEELNKVAKKHDKVASWVIAKMERANTDLSDVTHYLDGEDKFRRGGFLYEVEKIGGDNNITEKYFTAKNISELRQKILEKYGTLRGFNVKRKDKNSGAFFDVKFEDGGGVSDEIDYLDRRINSLEEQLIVINDEDKPRLQETITQLKDEKEYLLKKGSKSEEPAKKRFFFFNEGGFVDLFEDYDNMPENVQEIINEYDFDETDYDDLKEVVSRLEAIGYTFDYGLDGQPYGLRPLGMSINEVQGYEEEFKDGGSVNEKFVVYTENQDGYYRKLSGHETYRGAKMKMDSLWKSGEYENIGIDTIEEWNDFKSKFTFQTGGVVSKEEKAQNDLCIDVFVEFVTNIVDVNYAFTDSHNNKLVFVLENEPLIDTIDDMNEFLHISSDDCRNVLISDVEYSRDNKVLTVSLKKDAYTTFGDGGSIPSEEKMFHLPLEMVVYVPSTQDVDKVISVDEMDSRVDEVKTYLADKFGGYSSTDKLGGFVDSKGNLVNEEVVQVVSFATKEAFEGNKEELIRQISKWGQEWGQEAIGFEFEGDLYYVPQESQMMAKGGDVWIQDAVAGMKKKDTLGSFSKQAKRHKKTPVEFAKEVIENPDSYDLKTFRRAMFLKNTNPQLF